MTNNRFDPDPEKPYGTCENCDVPIPDRDTLNAHLHQTCEESEEKRSHRVRVTNPTRVERIRLRLGDLEDFALGRFVEDAITLVDRNEATVEEVGEAMTYLGDAFQDAWAEFLAESGDIDMLRETKEQV